MVSPQILYKKFPSASKKSFPTCTTGDGFSISINSSSSSSVITRPSQLSSSSLFSSVGFVLVLLSSSVHSVSGETFPTPALTWLGRTESGAGLLARGAAEPSPRSIRVRSATGTTAPSLPPGGSAAGVCCPGSFSPLPAPEGSTCWRSPAITLESCLAFFSGGGWNLLLRTLRMTSGVTEKPSARRSTVHSSGCSCFRYLKVTVHIKSLTVQLHRTQKRCLLGELLT